METFEKKHECSVAYPSHPCCWALLARQERFERAADAATVAATFGYDSAAIFAREAASQAFALWPELRG